MKIAHLSDLHLGKVVNNFFMLEDQRYMLDQIADKMIKKEVDAVVIAGDVYDRPVPPAEAVRLLNDFLLKLIHVDMEVFVIAGNHDNGERLAFASELLSEMRLHIIGTWNGKLSCTDLVDKYGVLHVYALPFIRPSSVNRFIEEEDRKVRSYTEAVRYALSTAEIDFRERNVLIAHQFVTGVSVDPEGSEELTVGGIDNVDGSVFDGFDYTALGHIHRAQAVGRETVRYAGTPLKYSFSEAKDNKTFTLITLEDKQVYRISTVSLNPLRDLEVIRGRFVDMLKLENVNKHRENYLRVILEDENDIPDAITTLRTYYPKIMRLEYDNESTRSDEVLVTADEMEKKTPLDLFSEFFVSRNNREMTEEQTAYVDGLIREIWEEGEKE